MFRFKALALMTTLSALVGIGAEAEARGCSGFSIGLGLQQQVYVAPAPVYLQPVERRVVYREAVGSRCAPVRAAPGYCEAVPVAPAYVPVYQEVYVERPVAVCQERVACPSLSLSWSWFRR